MSDDTIEKTFLLLMAGFGEFVLLLNTVPIK